MPEHFRLVQNLKHFQRKSSEGQTAAHYRAEKAIFPVCSDGSQKLTGLSCREASAISKLLRPQRKVSFMCNENLCFSCFQSFLRQVARLL
jgi:ribosomal protein L34E